MTPSQKRTLNVLRGLHGYPATAPMIVALGGSCASLPWLIDYGYVRKAVCGEADPPLYVWSADMNMTEAHQEQAYSLLKKLRKA